MTRVKIDKSKCSTALSTNTTGHIKNRMDIYLAAHILQLPILLDHITLRDLTITNSQHNMLIVHKSELKFIGNTSFENNNGTFVVTNGVVTFYETINFIKNSAKQYESIFLVTESNILFLGIATFINNEGKQGGAISAYNSVLHFYTNAEANLFVTQQTLVVQLALREVHILNLAMTLNSSSTTTQQQLMEVVFFVEDEGLWITGTLSINCFVQSDQKSNRKIILEKNKAGITGMDLFGGWIDICLPIGASNFLAFYENYDNYTDISSLSLIHI